MKRLIGLFAVLALCLPMVGEGQSIRYGETDYSLGSAADGSIRYRAPSSTLRDGLLAYWRLEESSGERADSFGSWALTENGTIGSAAGKRGNGADTGAGGASNYLSKNAVSLSNSFTISLWYKGTDASGPLFSLVNTWPAQAQVEVYSTTTPSPNFICLTSDGSNFPYVTYPSTINDNVWHHIVCAYDVAIGQPKAWLDGVSGGTNTGTNGPTPYRTAAPLKLFWGANGGLNGTVDEIAVWNRVLTNSEIQDLYGGGGGWFY